MNWLAGLIDQLEHLPHLKWLAAGAMSIAVLLLLSQLVLFCPSPAHQVALDLRPEGPSAFRLEPPGYMLHRWHEGQLVSHAAVLGDWPGPFPFFDASGQLID